MMHGQGWFVAAQLSKRTSTTIEVLPGCLRPLALGQACLGGEWGMGRRIYDVLRVGFQV